MSKRGTLPKLLSELGDVSEWHGKFRVTDFLNGKHEHGPYRTSREEAKGFIGSESCFFSRRVEEYKRCLIRLEKKQNEKHSEAPLLSQS